MIHTLKSGRQILLDEEDLPILRRYKINTMTTRGSYTRYVVCSDPFTRKYISLFHRIILNASDDVIIDHENGNGLDCRKENLRIANSSLNQQNRRLTKIENEVKGLFFRIDRGYWIAKIKVDDKQIHLGSFVNKEDAINTRIEAENKYFLFQGKGTDQ